MENGENVSAITPELKSLHVNMAEASSFMLCAMGKFLKDFVCLRVYNSQDGWIFWYIFNVVSLKSKQVLLRTGELFFWILAWLEESPIFFDQPIYFTDFVTYRPKSIVWCCLTQPRVSEFRFFVQYGNIATNVYRIVLSVVGTSIVHI